MSPFPLLFPPLEWIGPHPPPPAVLPPERLTRAERYGKIGNFAVGPGYGPVLEPMLIKAVGAIPKINPLLLPVGDDDEQPHLRWNMLFSATHCHNSTDPTNHSWSKEPATFPRGEPGDLIEQLSDHLQRRLPREDYEGASGGKRRALRDAYHNNRSGKAGIPRGQLSEALQALDWLSTQTIFGGALLNDALMHDRFNVVMPCMLELVCMERPRVAND